MDHSSRTTAKDVFYHLLAIVTLYIGVFSLIALFFQYINLIFPDQLEYYTYTTAFSVMRSSVAALVIVWPVYLFVQWLIARDVAAQPEKREVQVRKWLLYLTLFIASITMIVDLIILVNRFLSGDLTTRFALDVLTVLIIVGAVFSYYLWDLRRPTGSLSTRPKLYAQLASIAIVVAVAGGFVWIGSPAKQRQIRFDEQRVNDLQNIQYQVINYWQSKTELPMNLDELKSDITGYVAPVDPESGTAYSYTVKGDLMFELCAEFKQPNHLRSSSGPKVATPAGLDQQQNWEHDAGRVCFDRTIDPDQYKNLKTVPPTTRL